MINLLYTEISMHGNLMFLFYRIPFSSLIFFKSVALCAYIFFFCLGLSSHLKILNVEWSIPLIFFSFSQGFWVAAEVCPFLWKNSGTFNSFTATLSISLGLDSYWHSVVQKRERLCKSCQLWYLLLCHCHQRTIWTLANIFIACSCQNKVRSGDSLFGCFLATAHSYALLACHLGRLVVF